VNQVISKSGFIMEKIERSQLLAMKQMGYGEGSYAMDNMHKREMAIRTKDLRLVSKPMAEKIASSMGGQIVDLVLDSATEWAIMMEPIRNLRIYYILQRYSPDLYDFTILCANALVRAAKNLPTPA
jgi:hypothetical protein